MFDKVRADSPEIPESQALSLAVKICNDTAGMNGLVPTLLVFGAIQRIPMCPHELPNNVERLRTMVNARKEAAKLVAQSRLSKAIRRSVPATAESDVMLGDEVLMYREKQVGKWVGPYIVQQCDKKMLTLNTGDRNIRASMDKVKRYRGDAMPPSDNEGTETNADSPRDAAHSRELEELDKLLRIALDRNPHDGDDNKDVIEFAVKIIDSSDPRSMDEDFTEAINSEVDGLLKKGIWRKVRKVDVPDDAIILGGRFIMSLKNYSAPTEAAIARYVAQGHNDPDKEVIVHDTVILRISSIRVILSIAAILSLRLFSHDVTQA